MIGKNRRFHFSPAQTVTISFACMILAGAILLSLPFASKDGQSIGFLNALFTAASANCVTGLTVVNTLEHWTIFGKVVILILIQLGGVGFITLMTLSMLVLRQRISLRNRTFIQAAFNQDSIGGMVKLIRNVVMLTGIIEGIGAVLLTLTFYFSTPMSVGEAVYKGIFHSISAFCNAGFDIIGPSSLTQYRDNIAINFIIMFLIVSGGIGFIVLGELLNLSKNPKRKKLKSRFLHLSLHSRMALIITGILILTGTIIFLLLEWSNPQTLGALPLPNKILAALFQSVTLRTAGFNTIDQAGLTDVSKVISCLLMITGGSPAGTAGGFKTVSLGIIFFAMYSALKGKNKIEGFGRTMPYELLQKALTVTCLISMLMFSAALMLHFTEIGNPYPHSFIDLLFEASSATGTVGVTAGITSHLTSLGKMVIIMCMYLGRIGPVTAVVSLNFKMKNNDSKLSFVEERVIIG